MNKVVVVVVVITAIFTLIFTSVLTASCVNAQVLPQPSTPEFSIKYLKAAYNITTTNNGVTITQQIDNSTVELVIENQPYNYSNGNITYLLYYNVQAKSHFTEKWTELYPLINQLSGWWGPYSWYIWVAKANSFPSSPPYPSLQESNSTYTTLSLPAKSYPINTDFQVKTLIGHNSTYFIPPHAPWNPEEFLKYIGKGITLKGIAYDTSSNWSQTQTVSLPAPSSSPTYAIPTINEGPHLPENNNLYFLIIGTAVVVIILSLIGLYLRGKRKSGQVT
jgi:hypothetical protein